MKISLLTTHNSIRYQGGMVWINQVLDWGVISGYVYRLCPGGHPDRGVFTNKCLTTPDDPSDAVEQGIKELLAVKPGFWTRSGM